MKGGGEYGGGPVDQLLVEDSIDCIYKSFLELCTQCLSIWHMNNVILHSGFEHVAISFNGGKDCTVLMELFIEARKRYYTNDYSAKNVDDACLPKTPAIYVAPAESFAEVEEFITLTANRYAEIFDLVRYAGSVKDAFFKFMQDSDSRYKAVVIGIRRTDPYSLTAVKVEPTNNGWPKFVRIHPLLEWTYRDVWNYLLTYQVPYCSLYDRGYTSLGGANNTMPNRLLLVEGSEGLYRPAYLLADSNAERLGRVL